MSGGGDAGPGGVVLFFLSFAPEAVGRGDETQVEKQAKRENKKDTGLAGGGGADG